MRFLHSTYDGLDISVNEDCIMVVIARGKGKSSLLMLDGEELYVDESHRDIVARLESDHIIFELDPDA